jgi:hypothetical protein
MKKVPGISLWIPGTFLNFAYYILMNREYRTEMIELPTIANNMTQMTNLLNLVNFEEVVPVFFVNIIPTFCFLHGIVYNNNIQK